mmetsp:Transcript_61521/g.144113  ORF Transcript_61521/g.144113 Transcript_61521/m.144113 type:complete len:87 (+) Transcript_61521:700-960(+)
MDFLLEPPAGNCEMVHSSHVALRKLCGAFVCSFRGTSRCRDARGRHAVAMAKAAVFTTFSVVLDCDAAAGGQRVEKACMLLQLCGF